MTHTSPPTMNSHFDEHLRKVLEVPAARTVKMVTSLQELQTPTLKTSREVLQKVQTHFGEKPFLAVDALLVCREREVFAEVLAGVSDFERVARLVAADLTSLLLPTVKVYENCDAEKVQKTLQEAVELARQFAVEACSHDAFQAKREEIQGQLLWKLKPECMPMQNAVGELLKDPPLWDAWEAAQMVNLAVVNLRIGLHPLQEVSRRAAVGVLLKHHRDF